MYQWRNNKIKNQYDLQLIAAKNKGILSFSQEDLKDTTIKTKNFTDVKDAKMKRLIELAYIRGRLDGIKTADSQLDELAPGVQLRNEILKKPKTETEEKTAEQLYFIFCRVSNANDKIVYVSHEIKAHSEKEAMLSASSACDAKKQKILISKVVRVFPQDTMQFQFGIGTKEQAQLMELGKKLIR